MTNRTWRILFGAIVVGCMVAVQQPPIQTYPLLVSVLTVLGAVCAFLKAPEDAPPAP